MATLGEFFTYIETHFKPGDKLAVSQNFPEIKEEDFFSEIFLFDQMMEEKNFMSEEDLLESFSFRAEDLNWYILQKVE